MRNKRFVTVMAGVGLILAVLLGCVAHYTAGHDAAYHGQCSGIESNLGSASSPAERAYRLQEAAAAGCDFALTASDSSTTTPATPAATPGLATPTPAPSATTDSAPAEEREVVFYATMGDKVGINAYGPQAAQDPALTGTLLEDMSAAQFLQEMGYRIQRDPMLAASFKVTVVDGGQLDDAASIDALVASYVADHAAWDAAIAAVEQKFDEEIAAGVQTQHFSAGYYTTTYAIPAEDGSDAWIRTNASIWREGESYVTVGGVAIRYGCGGQPYWANPTPVETTMPEPASGMARDAEGTPYVTTSDTPPSGGGDGETPPPGGSAPPPSGDITPPGVTDTDEKPVYDSPAGVEQPAGDTTEVDESQPGQGSGPEPVHGSSDLGSDATNSGDGDHGVSVDAPQDGNSSELIDQGGVNEGEVADG